jgi:hypothetical protein
VKIETKQNLMAPQSRLLFSIRQRGKAVPYGGCDKDRPDGSAKNRGFKNLKRKPEELASIPEIQDNDSLRNALVVLNAYDSPFFTVGCEKACNKDATGDWMRGYLEFSFNYRELVADAQFYFKLFFDFNNWYWSQEQKNVILYEFELEGADFWEVSAAGFTMTVWITTTAFKTDQEAKNAWRWGLDTLVDFLKQRSSDPRYARMY